MISLGSGEDPHRDYAAVTGAIGTLRHLGCRRLHSGNRGG